MRFAAACAAFGLALAAGCATEASGGRSGDAAWTATWFAAPQPYHEPPPRPQKPPKSFADRSYRQTMRIVAGGSAFRLRFSNLYGTEPVTIAAVTVASAVAGAAPAAIPVLFAGRRDLVLTPGREIASDAFAASFPSLSEVVVTTRLANPARVETVHTLGLRSNTLHEGDASAGGRMPPVETDTFYAWVTGIDVRPSGSPRLVVCFGASSTDGFGSTLDANRRYPDALAELLVARDANAPSDSVVNAGIAGNRWTFDGVGPRGSSRFAHNVLEQPGATDVIVYLGINDIGVSGMTKNDRENVSADRIVAAIAEATASAKRKGLRVYLATFTPFGGTTYPGYHSAEGEAKRQQVNKAIRETLVADGVVDFDEALRDPADPNVLAARYDSGDHLHPSDAGYRRMAEAAAAVLDRRR